MRVKTIIKNKVEDKNKFLIGGLNWKEKKINKMIINQKIEDQIIKKKP
jgi:hypothetical protein